MPPTTARAATENTARCRVPMPVHHFCQSLTRALLDLHPHHVLVRLEQAVAQLHRELEGKARLLEADHHLVQVLRVARGERLQLRLRRHELLVERLESVREELPESRALDRCARRKLAGSER